MKTAEVDRIMHSLYILLPHRLMNHHKTRDQAMRWCMNHSTCDQKARCGIAPRPTTTGSSNVVYFELPSPSARFRLECFRFHNGHTSMKSIFDHHFATQLGLLLAVLLHAPCAVATADEPPDVLDLPSIMQQQSSERLRGVQLLQNGQRQEALQLFERSVQRVPHDALAHYNLACARALLGQPEPALASLEKAIENGFRGRETIEKEPDLASLRTLPRFTQLLAAASAPPLKQQPGWKYSVKVAKPEKGAVMLQPANMMWNQGANTLQVFVDLSDAGKGQPVSGLKDEAGTLLKRWFASDKAAGNIGDLYDNHDRGHSPLNLALFPQMTRIEYSEALKQRHLDNGVQRNFTYTHAYLMPVKRSTTPKDGDGTATRAAVNALKVERAVVLGNSSTAVTGTLFWRSIPRMALTSSGGAELLFQHYLNNHLYVYPEHQDHDPGHNGKGGWGDVFFANTPYYVISQGSSGTDQPFLQALAATLAAFPKDTKEHMRSGGLIAPTLQMILRRCNRMVKSDEDYLSGAAHPTVFEGGQIDPVRMVSLAHSLQPSEVPPLAALTIDEEKKGDPRKDYFDAGPCEEVLTTPVAIARICYSTAYWREMQVSAAPYGELKGSQPQFHWVVLRGDPERIEIKPVDGKPNSRSIRVGYHPRRPIAPGSKLESNRVDIGVFAHNGHHYSAPSILSFYFPDNEAREYDAQHRILSVDYGKAASNYADPSLVPRRDWRDEYQYHSNGALTGWTRFRGDEREEFDADGRLLVKGDDASDPPTTRSVRYERTTHPDGLQSVQQIVE